MTHTWENVYSIVEPQINADGVHVWPFDPALPVDVRFFEFGKRPNIRMTRHAYCELLYIQAGAAVYQIQERNFDVASGDLLVLSGSQFHRLCEFRSPKVRAAALYFRQDAISTSGDDTAYLLPFLHQGTDFPHVVSKTDRVPTRVYEWMQTIKAQLPAADQRARLAVKTYLRLVLLELVNHYAALQGTVEVAVRRQEALHRLQSVFAFLDQQSHEPITIEQAAALVNLSPSHFMRFFRQVTGQSFIAYLNQFRIARAEVLLTSTALSLAEISAATGFCDQSYFGLVFRRLMHCTPLQYRLSHEAMPGTER
jgi:AraC-like DNA-binding protein